MIGFANEDYKIVFFRTEKIPLGGRRIEKVMCKALETGKQYNSCIYKYIPDKLSVL